jgi:DNA modification methylase
MMNEILIGDVFVKLKEIPDKSVDCVVTSPPYWGLRDYGNEGQMGLEPNFHDYLKKLDIIMEELKRILKDTGTCWVNLGDTYSGSGKGAGYNGAKESWRFEHKPKLEENIQAKSRVGIPERFYINCIDNGWVARNHIVWTKNNAMPSSVKDRLTNKWESVFFFAKNKKYYFDLDAIRVPTITKSKPFNVRVRDSETKRFLQGATDEEKSRYNERGESKYEDKEQESDHRQGFHKERDPSQFYNPKGKNPGDIFQINTRPFPKAHFATFPVDLPTKILKCACPKDGTVLDPFFGAGTTGLAAQQLGLNWLGIELSEEYAEIAKERLQIG